MCLSIGTHKIINFPFDTNGKLSILDVPIFKHIVVFLFKTSLGASVPFLWVFIIILFLQDM